MPRKPSGYFDQKKYVAEYHRTHLKQIVLKVQIEEYEQFKKACDVVGLPMATVLRNYMIQYRENVLGDNPLFK